MGKDTKDSASSYQKTKHWNDMSDMEQFRLASFIMVPAFVIILISAYFFGSGSPRNKTSSEPQGSELKTWAYIMSQSELERHLKAPASAKFPRKGKVRIQKVDGFYLVNAHVDAQNSFGAALRQNYTAKMVHLGGDRWRCDYLELGTDVLIAAR